MAVTYGFTYGMVSMLCSLPVLLMLILASLKAKSTLELMIIALTYTMEVVPFTGVGIAMVISKSMAMGISMRIVKYINRERRTHYPRGNLHSYRYFSMVMRDILIRGLSTK